MAIMLNQTYMHFVTGIAFRASKDPNLGCLHIEIIQKDPISRTETETDLALFFADEPKANRVAEALAAALEQALAQEPGDDQGRGGS